jgi:hypothetical protein
MPRLENVMSPPDDGVVALKQQELAIRAKENKDDKIIAEKKIKLDKAKLIQKNLSEEEKIKSQEDIVEKKIKLDKAKLRQKDQSEEERIKSQEDIAALRANVERQRIKQEKKSGSRD